MMSQRFSMLMVSTIVLCTSHLMAMPSSDYGDFDKNSVLPLGGVASPHAGGFEIRGVYGGRKRRYVIERSMTGKCCKNKPVCLNILGNILSDCTCKKCAPQVPSIDGKSCQDDCPQGQEKNGKGGCCPIGKKKKPGGTGCEDDTEIQRKGHCPDGQVLDPKEGQNHDTPNPKCQIDDERNCKKPRIPATRPEGKEHDDSWVVDCGQPKSENERPKCNPKTHYTYIWIDIDGIALEECKKSRLFQERKKDKAKSLQEKFKDKWNKQKPQREEQEKERQDKLQQLKEHRDKLKNEMEEREKLKDQNGKKKSRMGKCSTVTALMIGVAQHTSGKRDQEDPYDWTSDYFDEEFVTSDDRLLDWPSDLDVEKIACITDDCVDAEAWMVEWEDTAQRHDLVTNWPTCSQYRRNLDVRCAKRSVPILDGYETGNTTAMLMSGGEPSSHRTIRNHTGNDLETRNPVVIIEILLEIGIFGARLGVSLLARTASSIARWAPRLSNMAKNTDRLFKVAPKGQGGARSVDAMKNAFGKVVQNPYFKKCLKDGVP